ncbi:unnamed protein product [Lymnaea stagnalis]|uniref:Arf-GAP with Rho-GAP domain, ANK repeat and PH domain-containing protein 1 n=1 Tax=Lymnaea stagnalis TaxID=6523 RepID=A0AAV2HR87_LYMST
MNRFSRVNGEEDTADNIYSVPPPARSSMGASIANSGVLPPEPSSPPPVLMPKKGNSFRLSAALLDRQAVPDSPRPTPRQRKSSLKTSVPGVDLEALPEVIKELKDESETAAWKSINVKCSGVDDSSVNIPGSESNNVISTVSQKTTKQTVTTNNEPVASSQIQASPGSLNPRPVPKPRPRTKPPQVCTSANNEISSSPIHATNIPSSNASQSINNIFSSPNEQEAYPESFHFNLPPDPDSLETMLNAEMDKKYGFQSSSDLSSTSATSSKTFLNDDDDLEYVNTEDIAISKGKMLLDSQNEDTDSRYNNIAPPKAHSTLPSYIPMSQKKGQQNANSTVRKSHIGDEKENIDLGRNLFSESNTDFDHLHRISQGSVVDIEPTTPKPFDIQPFKNKVPHTTDGFKQKMLASNFDFSDLDPLWESKPYPAVKTSSQASLLGNNIKPGNNLGAWGTAGLDSSKEEMPLIETNTYTTPDEVGDQFYHQIDKPLPSSQGVYKQGNRQSFHYAAPLAPPPPLPREQNRIPEPKAPPVPPRPANAPASGSSDQSIICGTSSDSQDQDIFDNLLAPVFTPKENIDPFEGSNFDYVCHKFNTTLEAPQPLPRTPIVQSPAAAKPDVDPERISRFVIPPPGTLLRDDDPSKDYNLAGEISSDSDGPDESMSPHGWPSNMRPVEAHITEAMSPKKNSRDGYLYKQGGHNANRGWRRRWVVFNGTSLSYYNDSTSQVSIRIIPIKCMVNVETDIKPNDKENFKFKLQTTLKNRIFLFSSDTRDTCVFFLLSASLHSMLIKYPTFQIFQKSDVIETAYVKPDKEGFIKFNACSRKYYVAITGPILQYYHSLEDYNIGSPIHQIEMKLASVKVKDRKKFKLQLSTHYRYFELTFEDDQEMQQWHMAMEDAIAEGLADDTVLEKVYDNMSNRFCADCSAEDPHWASINLGIVMCKNCAGVHRTFDYRVSKIRSLRMDTRVWTPSLIELMVTIGNANANAFWEFNLAPGLRVAPTETMEKRKEFITKKYIGKKFANLHEMHSMGPPALGKELVSAASSAHVLDIMKILFSGANVLYRINSTGPTAYEVAKESGQRLIMELLYQNSGDPQSQLESVSDENRLREDIRLQSYLNKTGPVGRKFENRWCVLEHGALTYYANEKSTTFKGTIDRKDMYMIQAVETDRIGYPFELSTGLKENRVFIFSSDCKEEAGEWVRTIAKLMAPIAVMEHVGMIDIKFAGAAFMKESLVDEWHQTFLVFSWRGLNYMNRDLRFDYLDLRKASGIKWQSASEGYQKQGPCFVISSIGRSLYIQATLPRDTGQMYEALVQAITGSGRTLSDQALTAKNVPVIVDRCITHINTHGVKEKGIYRQAGQQSRVQALLDEFRKDAYLVCLNDYSVHEVASALKKFLRELDDSVFERMSYEAWIDIAGCRDEEHKLARYRYQLGKMPEVNRQTLKIVIQHLLQVAKYEEENSMNVQNLSTCFAPSLLRTHLEELQLPSDTSSREIRIVLDILRNSDLFFKVDENEKLIQKNIDNAENLISSLQDQKKPSQNSAAGILTPVYLVNGPEQSVNTFDPVNANVESQNISVTADKTVEGALKEAVTNLRRHNRSIEQRPYVLYELLFKCQLQRPLFAEELISRTTNRWSEFSSWVDKDIAMHLCVRDNKLTERLKEITSPSFTALAKLQYREPKGKFNKKTIGLRQMKLVIFKGAEGTSEVASWNVEDITIYIGTMLVKKSLPSSCKGFLTFLVNGEDISFAKERAFGHCLGFDAEDEMHKWAAAIYKAQHPGSFN